MYDACSPQLGNRNGLVDISRPRLGGMTRGTMDIDGARNAKLEAFRKAFGYHEQATIAAAERLRDVNLDEYYEISEKNGPVRNAAVLAGFLEVDEDRARSIASTPYLFAD